MLGGNNVYPLPHASLNGGSDRFERLGRKYGANARWFHAMLTGRIL